MTSSVETFRSFECRRCRRSEPGSRPRPRKMIGRLRARFQLPRQLTHRARRHALADNESFRCTSAYSRGKLFLSALNSITGFKPPQAVSLRRVPFSLSSIKELLDRRTIVLTELHDD